MVERDWIKWKERGKVVVDGEDHVEYDGYRFEGVLASWKSWEENQLEKWKRESALLLRRWSERIEKEMKKDKFSHCKWIVLYIL